MDPVHMLIGITFSAKLLFAKFTFVCFQLFMDIFNVPLKFLVYIECFAAQFTCQVLCLVMNPSNMRVGVAFTAKCLSANFTFNFFQLFMHILNVRLK